MASNMDLSQFGIGTLESAPIVKPGKVATESKESKLAAAVINALDLGQQVKLPIPQGMTYETVRRAFSQCAASLNYPIGDDGIQLSNKKMGTDYLVVRKFGGPVSKPTPATDNKEPATK